MATATMQPKPPQEVQDFYKMAQIEDWYLVNLCLQNNAAVFPQRNRILLALKSQLPNEVQWALQKLTQISYYITLDGFTQQFIFVPELYRALLELLWDEPEYQLTVLNIIRNLSFIDVNVMQMLKAPAYLLIGEEGTHLAQGVLDYVASLLENCEVQEAVVMCIDILEHMAVYIKIKHSSGSFPANQSRHNTNQLVLKIFNAVKMRFAQTKDRYMVLSCLRVLSIFCMGENNHIFYSCNQLFLQNIQEEVVPNADIVKKCFKIMYTYDSEMTEAVLDLFYWWSNIYNYIGKSTGVEMFSYQGSGIQHHQKDVPFALLQWSVSDEGQESAVAKSPVVALQQLMKFLDWKAPSPQSVQPRKTTTQDVTNCIAFLKERFSPNPQATLQQMEMFGAYAYHCKSKQIACLQMTDFQTVLKIAFKDHPISIQSGVVDGKPVILVRGLQLIVVQAALLRVQAPVQQQVPTAPQSRDEMQIDQPVQQQLLPQVQDVTQRRLPQVPSMIRQPHLTKPVQQQSSSIESSIPLLTALVLRNLATCKRNHQYLVGCEQRLLLHTIDPNLPESVLKALTTVLQQVVKKDQQES